MKHRNELFRDIWIVAFGVILSISGLIIYGFWHTYWWAWIDGLVFALVLPGVIVIILGIFGIIMAFVKEYLDREKQDKS